MNDFGRNVDSERTTLHGKRACPCQEDTLPHLEAALRGAGVVVQDLSGLITQGAYHSGFGPSAGTHDLGGVWDVKARLVDTDAKRAVWFDWGWIPFHRVPSEGDWPEHGHVVVAGCPHRSFRAAKQERSARDGRAGLATDRPFRGRLPARIITWREAVDRLNSVVEPVIGPSMAEFIPRHITPRPWPEIVVDGKPAKQTMDRLRMQLQIKPTGSDIWGHWDVAALKVWLGGIYDGRGVLSTLDVQRLQSRVGVDRDGDLGSVTWEAFQRFLNRWRDS